MSNPVSLLPFWKSAILQPSFANHLTIFVHVISTSIMTLLGKDVCFFCFFYKYKNKSHFEDSATPSKAHYSNLLCIPFVATQHYSQNLFTLVTNTHDMPSIITEHILTYPSQAKISSTTCTYNGSLCSTV